MKKVLFLVVAMLMVSVVASAQFMNAGGSSNSGSGINNIFSGEAAPVKFNTFSFSYHPINFYEDYGRGTERESENLNGFSLEWNSNVKIAKLIPLYFGYGLGAQYSFGTLLQGYPDQGHKFDVTARFLSTRIPFELLYRCDIPNTKIAIAPYVGFDAIVHLLGKEIVTWSEGYEKESTSFSYFNEDEMGAETFRRFNIDWHIGAKFMINDKWFLGATYEGQILKLYSEDNYSVWFGQANISIGLVF